MALVYAVVHNGNGDFIICVKNLKGYFFHNPGGNGGAIIPLGQDLRGGGLPCFPGGTPSLSGVIEGAAEELEEELAIEVGPGRANPPYYIGNRGQYYGVYFNVAQSYDATLAEAREHLANAQRAVGAIQNGTYTQNSQYDALLAAFAVCPMDNELASADSWNVFYNRTQISALNRNPTDWFYNMIINLQQYLFPVSIYAPDGRLAGIGKTLNVIPGPQFIVDYILFDGALLTTSGTYRIVYRSVSYRDLTLDETPNQRGLAVFMK